jgi:hypothetical protein
MNSQTLLKKSTFTKKSEFATRLRTTLAASETDDAHMVVGKVEGAFHAPDAPVQRVAAGNKVCPNPGWCLTSYFTCA